LTSCAKVKSGFTLLETIVSIVILAMIALMMTRIFSESTRAVGTARNDAVLDDAARRLLDALEQDISQTLIRTNVAFCVHTIAGNDALYFVSAGMRRQLESIPRDTAPMRWQMKTTSSDPDELRSISIVSPYGSGSDTPTGIRKLMAHSDYYLTDAPAKNDFTPVHLAGNMSTTEKEYTQTREDSGLTGHAVATFMDITVNGDCNSNRSDSGYGLPPEPTDMPRFVDVAIGLISSADMDHALILLGAGEKMRCDAFIDSRERIYTRRIFLRNQGTGLIY
jgi:prepilin-type N-terminal cleavage/methylation domain-containing protein